MRGVLCWPGRGAGVVYLPTTKPRAVVTLFLAGYVYRVLYTSATVSEAILVHVDPCTLFASAGTAKLDELAESCAFAIANKQTYPLVEGAFGKERTVLAEEVVVRRTRTFVAYRDREALKPCGSVAVDYSRGEWAIVRLNRLVFPWHGEVETHAKGQDYRKMGGLCAPGSIEKIKRAFEEGIDRFSQENIIEIVRRVMVLHRLS